MFQQVKRLAISEAQEVAHPIGRLLALDCSRFGDCNWAYRRSKSRRNALNRYVSLVTENSRFRLQIAGAICVAVSEANARGMPLSHRALELMAVFRGKKGTKLC